ncbi:MAG: hypothetical protein HY914_05115 [Desulfomonile tiedjei]|nr:hypothetical protein [Desulfomonile tiedjei]
MANKDPYFAALTTRLDNERRTLRSKPSYSGFDYGKSYGTSPFSSGSERIGRIVDQEYGNYRANRSKGFLGSAGTHVARPGDREVGDYMENALAGQRNTLDDYVRRAAGAGIRRGGMNVVGGPGLDSSLHQQAMKSLASGYSDRFSRAMDYNKYVKSTQFAQSAEALRNLQNLLDLQHRYVSGQADWQNRLGDQMHEDWRGDVTWQRGNPERELAQEKQLQQMQLERESAQLDLDLRRRRLHAASRPRSQVVAPRQPFMLRSNAQPDPAKSEQTALASQRQKLELELLRQELEKARKQMAWASDDRTRTLDEASQREMKWRQLANRAGLASALGGYNPALIGEDTLWADRLGVELGYLKPWQRSMQLRAGGGGSSRSGGSSQSRTNDSSSSY